MMYLLKLLTMETVYELLDSLCQVWAIRREHRQSLSTSRYIAVCHTCCAHTLNAIKAIATNRGIWEFVALS